ncbi:guanine nucleotide-binding protein subunit beta-like protein 1 [Salminus brasiliensis]|uniref:guanine nucleotide-binding protein subunit beta-like protein 1 n=1 Tax=Salminus brasiliensis TaxID=930266 RepID=UPI003B83045F
MARPPPDPVFTLRGSAAPVNTLHFHCSGAGRPLLYSGSGKGCVHVWNLNSRRPETVLEGHDGASVIWVSTLNSTDMLLSQGRDMRVCVWDLHEGRSTVTHTLHTGSVGFCQCSLLEAGTTKPLLALPAEHTEEIKVVELDSQAPVCSLIPDSTRGMLMCMKMWQADSGPLLCAGYEDGSLVLWDVSNRRPLGCLKAHPDPVMCLDVDAGRQKGISGSSDKSLTSWTINDQQSLQMQDSVPLTNPGVSQVCVRADGKITAAAGWDGSVRVFGWKRLKPLAVLQHHKDLVHSVAFSDHPEPSQRLMAAGSKDQRISLWSIYSER